KQSAGKFKDLKQKRQKMIRTYYKDIIEGLKHEKYSDIAKKYENLSKRMARRNDYDTSSLMILLSVLSRIKAKEKLSDIKSNINTLLGSLGIVKKILEENFEIKVSYFIIDALSTNFKPIQSELQEILSNLPLLDEENALINLIN
ncbi:MAG: hypothetical protein ACTSXY_14440, partial [Promethearchaeota archaeon]